MAEHDGDETLRALAERAMGDKREELGDEEQARELFDVPSASAEDLARDQEKLEGE